MPLTVEEAQTLSETLRRQPEEVLASLLDIAEEEVAQYGTDTPEPIRNGVVVGLVELALNPQDTESYQAGTALINLSNREALPNSLLNRLHFPRIV